ncbi:DUF6541 family protein [Sinomonas sp. R1AF57]|uniref:DUF6541 family protein n=1 Tax=Sinomonas sp. R1AF57 TaxID=2020377 RepID=UPI000B5E1313|nr:DUF6541 family protein [Sinomonas sp. R1AF57]ASN52377.1 hypothetical protein CGQ25_10080 [Sinomonas sp. R1AF57]
MDLGPLALSVALIALVWWGPGWLLGEALGIRRILLPAVAPLIGVGALASIGAIGHLAGMAWNALTVAITVLVLAAVLFGVRVAVRRRRAAADPEPFFGRWGYRGAWLTLAAGILAGGVVAATSWTVGTEGLLGINQDWDIPWHANMIRLIAENQVWDPSIAGNFAYYDTNIADAPIRSYPIAFHAMLALVWPVTGVALPTFLNVFVVLMMAVQLPLSTVALGLVVTRRPVALAAAAAVSGWFTVYPFDLLWRGPLIPFFAGMLLVGPFCLLAVRAALGRFWLWVPAIAFGAVALIAVHPSLAFVVAPILVFWFIALLVRRRLAAVVPALVLAAGAVLAAVLGLPIIQQMLKEAERVSKQVWAADTDRMGAIQNILLLHHGSTPQPILSAMVGLGVVALLVRPKMWWYLAPVLAYAFLSAYTMGSNSTLFASLTAPFYDDQWRIFGILVMLLVPLAGLGVAQLAEAVGWAVRRFRSERGRRAQGERTTAAAHAASSATPVAVLATAAVVLLLAGVVARPYFAENAARIEINTKVDGATLSTAEVRLLTHIADYVPQDATVLNDSCNGSVWMYALGNRMPMIRHFEILPTNRQLLVLQKLPELATDSQARAAAAELGIEYVYIADGTIRAWDEPKPGLTHPDQIPFLKLLARDGNAAVYKLDWDSLPGGRAQLEARAGDRHQIGDVPGILLNSDPDGIAPLGRIC